MYYPIFLSLQGRCCVVIGGGPVAAGKVRGLLEAGAAVTVISPELTPNLQALAAEAHIAYLQRGYRPGDLAEAFLVISATADRAVNEAVWEEANARNILINVVDDTPHCSFIAPAILRRGDLTLAISTSGKAPALAVQLRDWLDRFLGDEYAHFLELAGALREPLAERYPDFEQRRTLWYRLVNSDVLELLRQGDEIGARKRITEIMGIAI